MMLLMMESFSTVHNASIQRPTATKTKLLVAMCLLIVFNNARPVSSFTTNHQRSTSSLIYGNDPARAMTRARSKLLLKRATTDSNDTSSGLANEEYVEVVENPQRRNFLINSAVVGILGVTGVASWSLFNTNVYTPSGFTRISPIQFIAALGDPKSKSGTNAKDWGLWTVDPGPRGVWLKEYEKEIQQSTNLKAPAGWTFNPNDWWLEEHGLIMEAPKFPMAPGRYLVTGGRAVTTGLTINQDGTWKLDDDSGATLYDVTHLPCRSARYTPENDGNSADGKGTPKAANPKDFPVAPGAIMPSVPGCNKQDYAVLFVVGKAI